MNEPNLDDLSERIPTKFALVTLAMKRARQIKAGSRPLIDTYSQKPVTISLQEILCGVVRMAPMRPAEEMEKEEQEAMLAAIGLSEPTSVAVTRRMEDLFREEGEERDFEEEEEDAEFGYEAEEEEEPEEEEEEDEEARTRRSMGIHDEEEEEPAEGLTDEEHTADLTTAIGLDEDVELDEDEESEDEESEDGEEEEVAEEASEDGEEEEPTPKKGRGAAKKEAPAETPAAKPAAKAKKGKAEEPPAEEPAKKTAAKKKTK